MKNAVKERLQKLMAQANLGSRRACESLIEQGRVRVNGKIAKVGDQADLAVDTVEVDGVRLQVEKNKRYYALYKPKNVVTTNVRQHQDERDTVRDLLPVEGHLFTIGRLDADSEGLVVLTNDGELANKLSHPRYRHSKTYKVSVYGLPTQETLEKWRTGVYLEDGPSAPCFVQLTKGSATISVLHIVMTEGKKRQIRRMATHLGHPVKRLIRTKIGNLDLGTLKPGEWRELSAADVRLMSTASSDLKQIRGTKGGPRREEAPAAPASQERRERRPARDMDSYEEDRPRRVTRLIPGDNERPRGPRTDEAGAADRPRRPAAGPGTRPYRAEWDSDSRERPAAPRRRTEGDTAERPRRPAGPGARSPRVEGDSAERPRRVTRTPRAEGDTAERPRRPSGPGTRTPRAEGDTSERPRRPAGSGTRKPRTEGDSKPARRPAKPGSGPARRDDNDKKRRGPR